MHNLIDHISFIYQNINRRVINFLIKKYSDTIFFKNPTSTLKNLLLCFLALHRKDPLQNIYIELFNSAHTWNSAFYNIKNKLFFFVNRKKIFHKNSFRFWDWYRITKFKYLAFSYLLWMYN